MVPEACIVNYYHSGQYWLIFWTAHPSTVPDSTLTGHRDDVEEEKEAPIVAIRKKKFGTIASDFLWGGWGAVLVVRRSFWLADSRRFQMPSYFCQQTPSPQDVEPKAILLRSGDAVVMADAARQVFHGVPRIFDGSWQPASDVLKHPSLGPVAEYLMVPFPVESVLHSIVALAAQPYQSQHKTSKEKIKFS